MNRISVVIPAYNAEKDIRRCVDSFLCQCEPADEIIIVDDGSDDATGVICDDICKKNLNVRVFHTKNRGPVSARRTGVLESRFEYIAFADADDWIEKNYIKVLKDMIADYDFLACGIYEDYPDISVRRENIIPEGNYESESDMTRIRQSMLSSGYPFRFGTLPYLFSKLYKKDILADAFTHIDENIYDGEDVVINCAYLIRCKKVVVCNTPVYHYVWQEGSLSREKKESFYDNVARIYRNLYDIFSDCKDRKDLIKQLDDYMRFMIWTGCKDGFGIYERIFFPFKKIPMGSKIVLYGAGLIGRILHHQLMVTRYCELVEWVDKYKNGEEIDGTYVKPLRKITDAEYDFVVVAIAKQEIVSEVIEELSAFIKDKNKIIQCL